MYKVNIAPIKHAVIIADLLSQHFSQQNSILETRLYNADYSVLEKIVSDRIADQDSPYKYLTLVNDAGACFGFVCIYRRGTTGEIQILLLSNEDDGVERINLLLEAANQHFKKDGVTTICTEVGTNEKVLRRILKIRNAKVVSENLVLAC